jgi:chemotaxis protein histidine kinase CheA
MNDIVRQIARARWRLNLERFLRVAPWMLFGALLVACVGLAIPKFVFLPATATEAGWRIWVASWTGGSAIAGLLAAVVAAWWNRRSDYEAAVEIDRRFGLRDRVASSLLLTVEERESSMGEALLRDTAQRVSLVEIPERFAIRAQWTAALPLAPAIGAVLLTLLANATAPQSSTVASDTAEAQVREQIRKSAEELKKRLEEQQKKAAESGLADADELFKKLQQGTDELKDKQAIDRKTALLNLNEMAKSLQQRRDGLSSAESMRKQLEQLKNFEQGPADKFGKAMQQGDMKQALKQLSQLQKELKEGKLDDNQRQQLTKQLEQMREQLSEAAKNFEQAKRELEQQIQQKQAAGETEAAAKLQKKLDELNKESKQIEKMERMAQKLNEAAEACKNGDCQKAADKLGELSEDLEQMQSQLDQLETVNELMEEIADAKSSMNCQQCQGQGCQECQGQKGQGKGQGQGQKGQGFGSMRGNRGNGMGKGRGAGERPEDDVDGKFYDTRAKTKLKAGEAVRTGFADGPNIAGKSVDSVRQEVAESLRSDPDALPDQVLTRSQREQARQFFEGIGKGGVKP